MRDPFGFVRLDALPAPDVWHAPTALTLYAVGPRSTVTVALNVAGLRAGDIAGLALFNRPYAWLGAERGSAGLTLARFDERGGTTSRVRIRDLRVWLRAECDFVRNEVGVPLQHRRPRLCGDRPLSRHRRQSDAPLTASSARCSPAARRPRPRAATRSSIRSWWSRSPPGTRS